jgi:hypothetical protein
MQEWPAFNMYIPRQEVNMKGKCIALAVALAFVASPCFSQTVNVFGPKTYNKERGAPVTYTDDFVVPTGTTNFQLVVKNGTEEAGAVKNVTILLNDVEVVSSSDLKGTDEAIKNVTFLPDNRLSVTLKGQGGNAVSVQLIGQAMVMPTPPPAPMPMMPPM